MLADWSFISSSILILLHYLYYLRFYWCFEMCRCLPSKNFPQVNTSIFQEIILVYYVHGMVNMPFSSVHNVMFSMVQFNRFCIIYLGCKLIYMLSISVGQSSWPSSRQFENLLPETTLLSISQCRDRTKEVTMKMLRKGTNILINLHIIYMCLCVCIYIHICVCM